MKNKTVALITDVAHFVGAPAARALLADGFTVYGVDGSFSRESERARVSDEVPGLIPLEPGSANETMARVVAHSGTLDVLINNDAFPALRAPVDQAKGEDLRATYEALVFKPFEMSAAVVPHFKSQTAGKILFLTSAAPLNGLANYSMYASARGAANALVNSLARELAPFNIQVNAVAPNYVENPDYFPPSLLANPDAREKILRNIPLGRLGKPEEAAALISFLCGPLSGFITGQIIPFAGGWAMSR